MESLGRVRYWLSTIGKIWEESLGGSDTAGYLEWQQADMSGNHGQYH